MQDRYVGDVGDFGKYGLLRLFAAQTDLRLSIIWYLFGDESHNSDGRHVGYLRSVDFARPDALLHASLGKLIERGNRSVKAVARSGIFPPDTMFFTRRVSDREGEVVDRRRRAASRSTWLRQAVKFSTDAELVFFDPDNGIETASVQRHSPKSGKYVYWEELVPFWQRGQSLLIYHHLNRTASVARQSEMLRAKFEERFPDAGLLNCFLFRRGSCRHFWLVAQERHVDGFRRAIDALGQSDWREYFEVG
jgi:hypothetical protein